MSIVEAIKSAADATAKVVAGVSRDQLTGPTPCSEFDVRELGNHMTGFLPYAANAVRKGPAMEGEAPDFTAGDWAASYRHMANDLVDALSEGGGPEGEMKFGSGTMPVENALGVMLMELSVHGWDLAKATGQTYELDAQTAIMAAAVTSQAGPNGREGGFFAAEVAAPEGASEFEKALAVSGRDPNWSA